MKNLIMAFGLTMVMIISVTILAALNTNTAQQSKLDNATELAAYQTLNEFYGRSSGEADLQKTRDNWTPSPVSKEHTRSRSTGWTKHRGCCP